MEQYSFFVDESCHLEHDKSPVMCVGAICVPEDRYQQYKEDIKSIKQKHGILHEVKWNTISNTHVKMYKELVDYFFASEMGFRCVLVTYKDRLDNLSFNNGEHDNFYYKLIYYLLYNPYAYNYTQDFEYKVFLDIKDTKGRKKLDKITQVLPINFTESHHLHISNISALTSLSSSSSPTCLLVPLRIKHVIWILWMMRVRQRLNSSNIWKINLDIL